MNIPEFKNAKNQKKLTMVTCYDASFAAALQKTDVDAVLVGDSVAMVVYGHDDTVSATVPMISAHVAAVRTKYKGLIVGDLPFLAAQKGQTDFVEDVRSLMSAGANAIKLEGVDGLESKISSLIQAGVPVMGHVGLTPQFVNLFGGFKVQGRTDEADKIIFDQALKLQELGCFSIVLECVPEKLAKRITEALSIPTVGIGAGASTDGQILVLQDLLGLSDLNLKFVKKYDDFKKRTVEAINAYCSDVHKKDFPKEENTFL
jgi:3-methyl-2-oxobutanoate hydroxymethyltransferase